MNFRLFRYGKQAKFIKLAITSTILQRVKVLDNRFTSIDSKLQGRVNPLKTVSVVVLINNRQRV